jgi:hypothetical protein
MAPQTGGATAQSFRGSCIVACGQMLNGGARTESEILSEIGAPTSPIRLAEALGKRWTGKYFDTGEQAVAAASRGPNE